jgi:hypothetical protein
MLISDCFVSHDILIHLNTQNYLDVERSKATFTKIAKRQQSMQGKVLCHHHTRFTSPAQHSKNCRLPSLSFGASSLALTVLSCFLEHQELSFRMVSHRSNIKESTCSTSEANNLDTFIAICDKRSSSSLGSEHAKSLNQSISIDRSVNKTVTFESSSSGKKSPRRATRSRKKGNRYRKSQTDRSDTNGDDVDFMTTVLNGTLWDDFNDVIYDADENVLKDLFAEKKKPTRTSKKLDEKMKPTPRTAEKRDLTANQSKEEEDTIVKLMIQSLGEVVLWTLGDDGSDELGSGSWATEGTLTQTDSLVSPPKLVPVENSEQSPNDRETENRCSPQPSGRSEAQGKIESVKEIWIQTMC